MTRALRDIGDNNDDDEKCTNGAARPRLLRWQVDANTVRCIGEAHAKMLSNAANANVHCATLSLGARQLGGAHELVHVACQLAYYRLHRRVANSCTYASTQTFRHGTAEPVRTASVEFARFAAAMVDGDNDERATLLRAALGVLRTRAAEVSRGLGIDRHLFGLHAAAKATGRAATTPLFTDTPFAAPCELSFVQSSRSQSVLGFWCPVSARLCNWVHRSR